MVEQHSHKLETLQLCESGHTPELGRSFLVHHQAGFGFTFPEDHQQSYPNVVSPSQSWYQLGPASCIELGRIQVVASRLQPGRIRILRQAVILESGTPDCKALQH